MKKIVSIILLVALVCSASLFSGCADDGKVTVGILQQAPHEALDAATEGFKQALIDAYGEDNIVFEEQNAAGDSDTCVTIANNLVSKNVDLIMANGTTALQAVANATLDIPILGTSITEYGVALDIDNFNGVVGRNISGTSDLAPLDEQAQMIIDLFPDAEKVGLLYCSAEPNSEYQVQVVKEYLEGKGLKCEEYTFSGSNDVSMVSEKAASDSDVIYIPTDNTAATCAETINTVVLPTGVPIITGESGICSGCGVATLSISYYELGYTTGEMAVEILKDGADITQMEIRYDPNPVKKYNKTICDQLGITVPDDYEPLS